MITWDGTAYMYGRRGSYRALVTPLLKGLVLVLNLLRPNKGCGMGHGPDAAAVMLRCASRDSHELRRGILPRGDLKTGLKRHEPFDRVSGTL